MAVRPGRLTAAAAAGLALAALLTSAAIVGAFAAHRAVVDARVDLLEQVVADDAAHVEAALEQGELVARALAEGAATSGVPAFRRSAPEMIAGTSVSTVALARLAPDRAAVVQTVVPAPSPQMRRGLKLDLEGVAEPAVLRAEPVIGFVEGDVLVVAPVAAPDPGATVADRRSATDALVVGRLDIVRLVDSLFDGADVRVSVDDVVVYDRGDPDGSLLRTTLDAGDAVWLLEVDRGGGGSGWVPWAVAGIGAALAIGSGVLVAAAFRARTAADARLANRTEQLVRIADAGARIQQTLDLGELLPAFALGLVDDFDLCHVGISLVDDDGRPIEAFATGDRGAGLPPQHVPLRRGWRQVGTLSIRPRRPLDEAETTSLHALGDLLAVALTNARLLQREQDAAARLRELDALKNAFLGTVSHELRTSMTAIMGFAELLVDAWDEMDDDRRRELAERVRRSAGSLRHLVDDLLDFARLEQQRLRVSPRDVDLAELVRDTVGALQSLLVGHRLELHADAPVRAHADPLAVERIVANLVSNAAKYAPSGTTVTVRVETVGDRARLVVDDEGPGIPPAERSRVFVRFYRLDTAATVRTRGAGIGLSILRDFADRSRAEVTVGEAPGGGARFVIDFPTGPAPDPADEVEPVRERVR